MPSNFSVNLLSHFYTLQTFLPGMIREERGTIVTVSSVLAHLGCKNLCKSLFPSCRTLTIILKLIYVPLSRLHRRQSRSPRPSLIFDHRARNLFEHQDPAGDPRPAEHTALCWCQHSFDLPRTCSRACGCSEGDHCCH